MTRTTPRLPAIVLTGVLAATACLDSSGLRSGTGGTGGPPPETSAGLIVSAPVRPPTSAAPGIAAAATSSATLVYVSLPPGSVPTGLRATITNQATSQSITAAVLDGGFDPVSIGASVGDTLVTEITGPTSALLDQVRLAVSGVHTLKTVRTSPPSGGHDVPLNAALVIVFSEPVDPTTVSTASVQLWRDSTPVAGTVGFSDSTRIRVEFRPANLLAPQTAYRLVATQAIRDMNGTALASPLSVSFTTGVTVQLAAQLAFIVEPSDATENVAISPTVAVAIQDASGNTVTSANSAVTVTIGVNAGGGTLWGTTSATAVNGVATFSLAVSKPGTGYTLTAGSGTLTGAISAPFAITPPPATRVVFTVQPSPAVAGDSIKPAVVVAIQSASGETLSVTSAVTVALGVNPASGTLSGTTTVNAVNGLATFANLSLDQGGTGYTLTASSGTLTGATSTPFTISPAVASKLAFTVQPITGAAGGTISPAVVVAIQNASGTTLTRMTSPVTVALGANPASGTLSGATTVNAVNGLATFANLSIDKAGTGYTLTASSGTLASATSAPVAIVPGLVFATVSAAQQGYSSCGVTTNGAAYCWGAGALGNGTTGTSSTPVPVVGGLTFSTVSAGAGSACGVTTGGAAYCWGSIGYSTTSLSPVAVAGGLSFASVSAGASHVCGVTTSGAAYCWGVNDYGELGVDTTPSSTCPNTQFCMTPRAVLGGLTFASVSAGEEATCGVTTAGAAYCWGQNSVGQLGIGTLIGPEQCPGDMTTDPTISCSHAPVAVAGGLVFRTVSVGGGVACGLTTSGAAYCWGGNSFGTLGIGTAQGPETCSNQTFTFYCSPSPVAVAGGLTFTGVAVAGRVNCGTASSGAAYCWGLNEAGELGDGTTTNRVSPTPVAGGFTFAAVSTSGLHTCGLTTGGVAYCWGWNPYGELGNGTATSSLVPVKVAAQR